ncbi:MAG: imidazoleglycerol-phosphate dehydratase HisB [Deltaproteobacteria bacterium]|nr:imidazoleglycerol-phosphate dehydratase HisB [Deltaproteobacteria bacterium]MBM4323774.1 imidazoleglycerol-phosphate dehydratase HisB [Deltaproteobacteria bacterium]MBM4346854.1 imidazoleglycerol-phosphate dehydratase HisB [Deltaproteobacteria bacterium]
MKKHRKAEIKRKTKETDILLKMDLDGSGKHSIKTGIPFFDHMLSLLSHHSHIDLSIKAKGDIGVDAHHTVEDVGICLGDGIRQALGESKGIQRYGMGLIPMDETLASVTLDLSMRPCLVYHMKLKRSKIGTFDLELVEEFMRALANHAKMTLHINLLYGRNSHHMVESVFKGLGRALRESVSLDERAIGVPSTKGVL